MKKLALLVGGLGFLLLCTAWAPALASSPDGPGGGPLDIVLVLDNSGSMQKNDPSFLMPKVAVNFLESLSPDDRLAMIFFDTDAKVVQPLQSLVDTVARQAYADNLNALDYRGKWTNSHKAVERAVYLLKRNSRKEAGKIVIFMTDGILETGTPREDEKQVQWLRQDLTKDAKNNDIRIFGLAFTEKADFSLIQSLAVQTGGEYYRALVAEEIEGVFQQIARDLAKRQTPATPAPAAPPAAQAPAAQAPATAPPAPAPQAMAPPSPAPEARKAEGLNLSVLLAVAGGAVVILAVILLVVRGRRGGKGQGSQPGQTTASGLPNLPRLLDLDDLTGQQSIELPSHQTVIGREKKGNVNLVLPKPTISSLHATIHYQAPYFYLEDQRSTNGTFLNGVKLEAGSPARLKSGDEIIFDQFRFRFVVEDEIMMGHTQIGGLADDDMSTQIRPVTQGTLPPAPESPPQDRWPSPPLEEQPPAPPAGQATLPGSQEPGGAPPRADDPWASEPSSPGGGLSATAYAGEQEAPLWPESPAGEEPGPAAAPPPPPLEPPPTQAPTPATDPGATDFHGQPATQPEAPGTQPATQGLEQTDIPSQGGAYQPLESPTQGLPETLPDQAPPSPPTPPTQDLTQTADATPGWDTGWPTAQPGEGGETPTSPGQDEPYTYIESPTVAVPPEPAPDQPPPSGHSTATAGGDADQEPSPPAPSQEEDMDDLNRTMIKMPNCPNHPDDRATELCPVCRQAYCAQCMTEANGREMCRNCAKS